jgi:hypothetical protein
LEFVQNLRSSFSSSTYRSKILVSHLGPHLKVVKHFSNTRWSAHADAVTILKDGYEEIKMSLDALLNDIKQSSQTSVTAQFKRKWITWKQRS